MGFRDIYFKSSGEMEVKCTRSGSSPRARQINGGMIYFYFI
jgi:hypothetical protein